MLSQPSIRNPRTPICYGMDIHNYNRIIGAGVASPKNFIALGGGGGGGGGEFDRNLISVPSR